MSIKKSGSPKGVTKSAENLTPEDGGTIKRAVDFIT